MCNHMDTQHHTWSKNERRVSFYLQVVPGNGCSGFCVLQEKHEPNLFYWSKIVSLTSFFTHEEMLTWHTVRTRETFAKQFKDYLDSSNKLGHPVIIRAVKIWVAFMLCFRAARVDIVAVKYTEKYGYTYQLTSPTLACVQQNRAFTWTTRR